VLSGAATNHVAALIYLAFGAAASYELCRACWDDEDTGLYLQRKDESRGDNGGAGVGHDPG